ncbi:MAG: hypothetical protein AUK47_00645 [Deltaproteobacteria bacterium CG2_30_63_29]|nr:MAG: hypothetical protein AUK47_00645 [Deltaproteobacteria bacterium CG2_30_63_29]PJB39348.1 MAG: hypothetical protein CO108_17360 [Deltaproteobacteria bacterium CG_4_9_14_3_um_filter_63_12]
MNRPSNVLLALLSSLLLISALAIGSALAQETFEEVDRSAARHVIGELESKESLSKALNQDGIRMKQIQPAVAALSTVFNFRKSRQGDGYEAWVSDEGTIIELRYMKGSGIYSAIWKGGDNFSARSLTQTQAANTPPMVGVDSVPPEPDSEGVEPTIEPVVAEAEDVLPPADEVVEAEPSQPEAAEEEALSEGFEDDLPVPDEALPSTLPTNPVPRPAEVAQTAAPSAADEVLAPQSPNHTTLHLAVLLVVLACGGAFYFFKHRPHYIPPGGVSMKHLGSVSLGGGQHIALVEAGSRILVLAVGAGRIALLSDIPDARNPATRRPLAEGEDTTGFWREVANRPGAESQSEVEAPPPPPRNVVPPTVAAQMSVVAAASESHGETESEPTSSVSTDDASVEASNSRLPARRQLLSREPTVLPRARDPRAGVESEVIKARLRELRERNRKRREV